MDKSPHKQIVVCDDNQGILDVVKLVLEKNGFSVTTCIDGDSIFNLINKTKPQLILLDLWMPGMGGEVICKTLKSNPKTELLPVVFMSASQDVAKVSKSSGADDFLEKPFGIADLAKVAQKYVQRPVPV